MLYSLTFIKFITRIKTMAHEYRKIVDAEIIGSPKKKKILRKDSCLLNLLLIAVIVLLIGGAGFYIGRSTAPEPTVKVKKVITDTMGNEWFTIKHKVDDMDTPEEFKGTKFYAGFIQFKNMRNRVRVFNDVTHFTIGCSGDMFKDGGQLWCTNDWIIKLSETIPEDVLKKYNK